MDGWLGYLLASILVALLLYVRRNIERFAAKRFGLPGWIWMIVLAGAFVIWGILGLTFLLAN